MNAAEVRPIRSAQKGLVVETITPKMAEAMLKNMVANRGVSDGKVLEYAIEMEGGRWSLNGETVKFNVEGQLFDGQHRLRACVLADKPFKTYVAYGISDENAFATVDVGKNRSHQDIFSISGYPSAALASSTAMTVYLYKHDMLTLKGPRGTQRYAKGSSGVTAKLKAMPPKGAVVSKEELAMFAEPMKDRVIGAVRFAQNTPGGKLVPKAMIGGLYFLFAEKSEADAKRFFADLCEGVGLSSSDPVYRLRERLIANAASMNKLSRWAVMLLTVKAWNKRRSGEKAMMSLKLTDGEEFPKIK